MIKAIIFDLDDTLLDTTAYRKILMKKIADDICTFFPSGQCPSTADELFTKMKVLRKTIKHTHHVIENIIKELLPDDPVFLSKILARFYDAKQAKNISLFPQVREILMTLQKTYKLLLVTTGRSALQYAKVDATGIRDFFDILLIDEVDNTETGKAEQFMAIQTSTGLLAEEIVVVGDKLSAEIKEGNRLGMYTVQLQYYPQNLLPPTTDLEKPNSVLDTIEKLPALLDGVVGKLGRHPQTKRKIAVIGGGTGLPSMLLGLKKHTKLLTAVVGITDSGRSSGIIRKEFDMAPPGDIRNNLIALSTAEKLMADMFQYRFTTGSLEGHSLGNLLITALTQIVGSFDQAIEAMGNILKIRGKVCPASNENVHICAEFEDGTIIKEENNIIDRHNKNVHLRSPIKRVFLDKNVQGSPQAVQAIMDADIVVIGPGSLNTSVITNLLIPDIQQAVINSSAIKVYICNIMTQPSQTYNFKVSDHIQEIEKYIGTGVLDYIICNNKKPSAGLLAEYEKGYAQFVEIDKENLAPRSDKLIAADIIENVDEIEVLRNKLNLLRHDSDKIADIIMELG